MAGERHDLAIAGAVLREGRREILPEAMRRTINQASLANPVPELVAEGRRRGEGFAVVGDEEGFFAVLTQRLAEANESSSLRCRLGAREAAEPAERRPIVEGLGELQVGKIIPDCEQQRLEQCQRRPSQLAFRRTEDARELPIDAGSVDQRHQIVQG